MNIYVGNISPKTSESQLRKAFEVYGTVDNISLDSGLRDDEVYGFCCVDTPFDNQASRAIKQLHGKKLGGCTLSIKESGVRL